MALFLLPFKLYSSKYKLIIVILSLEHMSIKLYAVSDTSPQKGGQVMSIGYFYFVKGTLGILQTHVGLQKRGVPYVCDMPKTN